MLEFRKSRPITRKLSDRQRDERMDRHKNDPISKEPFKQSTGSNKILQTLIASETGPMLQS